MSKVNCADRLVIKDISEDNWCRIPHFDIYVNYFYNAEHHPEEHFTNWMKEESICFLDFKYYKIKYSASFYNLLYEIESMFAALSMRLPNLCFSGLDFSKISTNSIISFIESTRKKACNQTILNRLLLPKQLVCDLLY
ncbi:hypothetical protein NIES2109_65120 (plasmid) [Nostoc sp. HK-01]|nr:hypothetical protein NIES2109_65120 [Nostoc sp. HK-01]